MTPATIDTNKLGGDVMDSSSKCVVVYPSTTLTRKSTAIATADARTILIHLVFMPH